MIYYVMYNAIVTYCDAIQCGGNTLNLPSELTSRRQGPTAVDRPHEALVVASAGDELKTFSKRHT